MSLQDQLDQAHERIAQLEEMLGLDTEFPLSLALTPTEAQLLGLLLRRPIVSVEMFDTVLYGGRPDILKSDPRTNMAVYVHRLRQKLKPHGIPIVNVWSRGHRLTDDGRRKLKEIIEDAE